MNKERIDAFFESMDKADDDEVRQLRDTFYAHLDTFSAEERAYLNQRLYERTQTVLDATNESEREAEAHFEKKHRLAL
jgi:hypothetical protein